MRSLRSVVFKLFFFFLSRILASQDLKANPLSATSEELLRFEEAPLIYGVDVQNEAFGTKQKHGSSQQNVC